jgi:type I restriction enzyme S subunit
MSEKKNTKSIYNTEIPSDWELKEFVDIALFVNGKAYKQEELLAEGKYKVLRVGNLFSKGEWYYSDLELEENKYVNDGDLMYAWSASFGPQFWIGEKTIYHYHIWKVIPNNQVMKQYLFFALDFDTIKIFSSKQGGTMFHVTKGDMEKRKLKLPPFPEQTAIAKLLSTWDYAITKTQSLIAQKEQRKKWLMQNLLTGKKRLKGFEEKWKEIHIRDVSKEISIKNKDDKQLTVLSCTKYDGLVPSLEYFGRKIFADDVSTYKVVPKNHFAYATNHIEEGSIGYQKVFDEALISPMYTVFKTDDFVNDTFFYKLLKSYNLVYQYQNRMEGSIDRRGGLRWDAFSIIKISLPKFEEQTAIAQVLQTADKEIQILKNEMEKLQEQKKGLMQVLLTGKKRLKIKNEIK